MKTSKFIKPLVSVGMLFLALSFVDIDQLVLQLREVSFTTAVVVTFGYALGQVLSSYKWWLIARSGGLRIPFTSALRAYFIGMYANCFGLGLVGGDVTRAVLLAGRESKKAQALASVVADRAHGLATLVIVGMIFSINDGRDTISPNFSYFLFAFLACVILGWTLGPKIILGLLAPHNRFRSKIEEIIGVLPKDLWTISYITLLSAVFHIFQVWLHWLILDGLGLDISLLVLLGSIPFVSILCSLPISYQGVGVRETSYIFFLSSAGLSKEHAILLGAIWFIAVTITGALGGIVAFLSKPRASSQTVNFEQNTEALTEK
ncbi:MAG: flippase-like domain-containing protein [Bdellovibrionales bacterium]|nr:flippase-like domain-containing protein [Bdellovibrionales bacterium]